MNKAKDSLESKASELPSWNSTQVTALAIYFRIIKEGKAEDLFAVFEKGKVSKAELVSILKKLERGFLMVYAKGPTS